MTKIEMYEQIKGRLTELAEIEFIDKQIELIKKGRAYRSGKPTATQVKNQKLKDRIISIMGDGGEPRCIGEIAACDEELDTLSNQKMSALLKQLVDEGYLIKTYVKRKAFYTLKPWDEE